jgi:hypothetical protein
VPRQLLGNGGRGTGLAYYQVMAPTSSTVFRAHRDFSGARLAEIRGQIYAPFGGAKRRQKRGPIPLGVRTPLNKFATTAGYERHFVFRHIDLVTHETFRDSVTFGADLKTLSDFQRISMAFFECCAWHKTARSTSA